MLIKRPRAVSATEQGRKKLNEAKELKRTENNKRISLAKIAEKVFVEETTVKRFFRGEKIFTDNAEAICKELNLNLDEIVDLQDFKQQGTTITLNCSINEAQQKVENILEALRKESGDETITIRIMREGSVIIIIDGSDEGLKRIESLFNSGELKHIAGFPVQDIRPEWENKPITLSQWFDNIFTTGWQSVEELLTPQQLSPAVWSDRTKLARLFDLKADLITHQVTLVINLTRDIQDKVSVWLQVYPRGTEYLPTNLKLFVLVDDEVFEEITARNSDVLMQCQFDSDLGDKFTVKLELGEFSVTEHFTI